LSGNNDEKNNAKHFVSPFFNELWKKVTKSIIYIFIGNRNINQENNAYQID
jgi:hypothetical protein